MPFTMEDFRRQFVKEHFPQLSDEEQEEVLQRLPPEKRLAGLTEDQIRQHLDRLSRGHTTPKRKSRRKK